MTILEAIQTAISNLEGVVLPVRDAENASRIRNALTLLDALKETVNAQTETKNERGKDGEKE